jgi:hypothetical protein
MRKGHTQIDKYDIVARMATIGGVWICNRIYCTRTLGITVYTLYNSLQLSLSGLSQQLSLPGLSVSKLITNSAESLARARDLLQTHFTISELSTQTALPMAS